jgi:putative ABC transport system permease protein
MFTWIKMAARNLARHGRRSGFTVLAIGLGFAAVNVFYGFTDYIFTGLQDGYIYTQGNGHLSVFKRGFLTQGKVDPTRYLLTADERERIRAVAASMPDIALTTPQLDISGLLSNGEISTIFVATGRVPSAIQAIRKQAPGMFGKVQLFKGKPLTDEVASGVGLSSGLAKLLGLGLESEAVAMAPTVNGQINALDLQVYQTFESPLEAMNDKLMLVPLAFAQSLYDTESIDRVNILLRDTGRTDTVRIELEKVLFGAGLAVEIQTWEQLSPLYTKVKDMFDVIFLFLFMIVFVIVVMSVINTIGMSVMERTREIGTLRAIGMQRGGIVRLYAIESLLLGLAGSFLGLVFTGLTWLSVIIAKPTWVPPQITRRVPLEVHLVPETMLLSLGFMLMLALAAAIPPATRAARMNIVNSLAHT